MFILKAELNMLNTFYTRGYHRLLQYVEITAAKKCDWFPHFEKCDWPFIVELAMMTVLLIYIDYIGLTALFFST